MTFFFDLYLYTSSIKIPDITEGITINKEKERAIFGRISVLTQPLYKIYRIYWRVLYAPVQNRHNTGKSEAVVAYNTDQSLGSLGCF